MTSVEDFRSLLREALNEAEGAGFGSVVDEVRARCFATYTTSSEWLGEVGDAIADLIARHGADLPRSTVTKLNCCLREVGKVWPKYHPGSL